MDYRKGFSATFFVRVVDPDSWRGMERDEITEGSISRSDSDLRQSADLKFHNQFSHESKWLRIYAVVKQDQTSELHSLFTGLATSPGRDIDGNRYEYSAELFSTLYPADKALLPLGYYVPAGSNGARAIRTLLSVSPAPVEIEGDSPTLASSIIAEKNESHLSMAEKILSAIGWRITLDGDGVIHITPYPTEPVARYDPIENDAIEPQISEKIDKFDCPNVFRAVSGDSSAVARDDSEDSELSTVNRGIEIWKQDTSCKLQAGETIGMYAKRMLKESQKYTTTYGYNRRFNPVINVGDVIALDYPAQGIKGKFRVTSQSIELSHGIRTDEEVIKI